MHPNFDRYSAMVDRSPFAVATAVALPAATPDFAKDLYVANAAHSPDADMVTIASTSDRNFKKYLTSKQPVDGYRIESVEWSDRVGASKVTISKDGKFATLTFNEALLSQRTAPNAPPAPDQVPQSMPPPQSMPQMPSSAAVQAPGVPAKALRKPGAIAVPAPNPQQQQQEQQQEQQQQQRYERKVGDIAQAEALIANDSSAAATCERCAIRHWTFGVLFFSVTVADVVSGVL